MHQATPLRWLLRSISAGASFRTVVTGMSCAGLALSFLKPAGAVPTAPTPAVGPQPVIEIRELTKDGGTVEAGTTLHYQFTVTNPGKADLELKEVKPSC